MTTETNAERLENMSPIGVDNDGNFLVNSKDWFWLQEQAERAQELEKQIELSEAEKGLKATLNEHAIRIIEGKDKENARLREALKLVGSDICSDEDMKFIVEKALKGESE